MGFNWPHFLNVEPAPALGAVLVKRAGRTALAQIVKDARQAAGVMRADGAIWFGEVLCSADGSLLVVNTNAGRREGMQFAAGEVEFIGLSAESRALLFDFTCN